MTPYDFISVADTRDDSFPLPPSRGEQSLFTVTVGRVRSKHDAGNFSVDHALGNNANANGIKRKICT